MEIFTALCLGFFWGCVITEICEKYKKKQKCCCATQTECLEQGEPSAESLIPKTEEKKE